ncbi:MAG TPA: VWA domain-containing protein, partial [Candidatus Binataceae bacterium]
MGLLNPLNLLYGASLIALAIIYFRSRSRPILEVPSLLLFEEQPAPVAGAARFWSDLLFWLEASALAALVLAAAGFYVNAPVRADRAQRHALVFDTAAAMAARERSGTRLDIAKREALRIVDGGSGGEQYAVIGYSTQARIIRPSTGTRDSIRRAILALNTEAVAMQPAAFDAAMMAARDADLIEVFADRLPKSLLNGNFAGRIRFHQEGFTDDNAAIVELSPGTVHAEQGYCVV